MQQAIIISLYAAVLAWWYVNIINRIKHKPFTCEVCMAGWLIIAVSIYQLNIYTLSLTPVAMMFAAIITRLMQRL